MYLATVAKYFLLFGYLILGSGMSTQFYEIDEYNPNPSLACGGSLKDTMRVVAHRTLPCNTRLTICNKDLTKCTEAVVKDRGPYGCKVKVNKDCVIYKSEIDLSKQTSIDIRHSGMEPVFYFGMIDEENRTKHTIHTPLYKPPVL